MYKKLSQFFHSLTEILLTVNDFENTGYQMKFAFGVYNSTDFRQP